MQSAIPYNTVIEALIAQAKKQPDAIYLHQPINRQYRTWTWAQTLDEVRRMAAALAARTSDVPSKMNRERVERRSRPLPR